MIDAGVLPRDPNAGRSCANDEPFQSFIASHR